MQSGEVVVGIFKDDEKRHAVFLANQNAYTEQKVTLTLSAPRQVSLFNRHAEKWKPLELKPGTVTFPLTPAGGELLRFGN